MDIGLPNYYSSAADLPFNRSVLGTHFKISTPDQDPETSGFWLILQGRSLWVEMNGNVPQLPFGPITIETGEIKPLYIGEWQGMPCRAIELPPTTIPPKNLKKIALLDRNPQLQLALFSLAGIGIMTLNWDKQARFCSQCGNPLIRIHGKWSKKCCSCSKIHFPCINTCVIGLVIKNDEILLVRKPEWKDKRFGLVAGFVEFGECLEEAMAREIREETNIIVKNIRFIGSQSWPFPNQIMAGYVADYAGGEIAVQTDELAEANWYKLSALPLVPPRRSIARYIIDQAQNYICRKD